MAIVEDDENVLDIRSPAWKGGDEACRLRPVQTWNNHSLGRSNEAMDGRKLSSSYGIIKRIQAQQDVVLSTTT